MYKSYGHVQTCSALSFVCNGISKKKQKNIAREYSKGIKEGENSCYITAAAWWQVIFASHIFQSIKENIFLNYWIKNWILALTLFCFQWSHCKVVHVWLGYFKANVWNLRNSTLLILCNICLLVTVKESW